jgi:hypothetical protein
MQHQLIGTEIYSAGNIANTPGVGKIVRLDQSPIPPLPLGEGRVRATEKTGERLRVRCCPTLV